jgi:hypothetical protein
MIVIVIFTQITFQERYNDLLPITAVISFGIQGAIGKLWISNVSGRFFLEAVGSHIIMFVIGWWGV